MSSSNRGPSRKRGRGRMCFLGWALRRTDARASHAIWAESCRRLDYARTDNHYTRPISFGCGLDEQIGTQRVEVFIVFVSVLIAAHMLCPLSIATNCVGIHDCLMSSLISLN